MSVVFSGDLSCQTEALTGTLGGSQSLGGQLQRDSTIDGSLATDHTVVLGLSAFDIAVKNGFKGTEEEWLESLHGITPVKGRDYFTEADKAEMVSAVIAEGGVKFETDSTLKLDDGILSVVTTDSAVKDDIRPITSGAVYEEFSKAVALLKTI